ncbi:hypothetical protein DFH08DRAFT_938803, partial [Mycena albidolilacea]
MPPQSCLNLLAPRLPLELERKIFESAALARPMSIPHLMLVAWRVKEWVGPLLYHVVFLCSPSPMRKSHSRTFGLPTFTEDALQQRPTTCFRRAKHLFIGFKVDPSAVESWLPACSGVTNLFAQISYPTKMLHALSVLCSVRHLTIDIRSLSRTDGPCPLFRSVTHLELFELYDIGSEPEDGADRLSDNLALIPHLTHIAFNPKLPKMVSHAALAADTRLQCIAFLVSAPYTLKKTSPLLEDDRFVCVQQNLDYRLDWLRGAVTGDDYWALAEAFIAARLAGRVDRMCLHCLHSPACLILLICEIQDRATTFPTDICRGRSENGICTPIPYTVYSLMYYINY